jgi:hypothetical protein
LAPDLIPQFQRYLIDGDIYNIQAINDVAPFTGKTPQEIIDFYMNPYKAIDRDQIYQTAVNNVSRDPTYNTDTAKMTDMINKMELILNKGDILDNALIGNVYNFLDDENAPRVTGWVYADSHKKERQQLYNNACALVRGGFLPSTVPKMVAERLGYELVIVVINNKRPYGTVQEVPLDLSKKFIMIANKNNAHFESVKYDDALWDELTQLFKKHTGAP